MSITPNTTLGYWSIARSIRLETVHGILFSQPLCPIDTASHATAKFGSGFPQMKLGKAALCSTYFKLPSLANYLLCQPVMN
ncbi:hypothetical protein BC936DRAFT_137088 [Jimgerdemannia flammicorona]|uniref:Uncharacterized protein n=1 Tax=Jimgerdemannia flammicorona TaxID=994334 RepID=A0A433CY29_9FUNG|nr:hypothetical protein BC936DRAFT_137088 [Jimgerdemannia flammicorona]